MNRTGIAWTDRTWGPVRGCSRVSEGCRNCYAEKIAARFSGKGQAFEGFATRSPAHWTGRVELLPEKLDEPLRLRKPQRIFVNSTSDLFHEKLTDGEILRVFWTMADAPQHTFQVLTKRPARMLEWMTRWMDLSGEPDDLQLVRGPEATRKAHPSGRGQMFASLLESMGTPPPGCAFPTFDWSGGMQRWPRTPFGNVWLGVSVEDQKTADERIPLLLQTPASVRFVSYEPALGPVDFNQIITVPGESWDVLDTEWDDDLGAPGPRLDWVIVGGESGSGARPFDITWARETVRQCGEAGVPVFVKQLGAKPITDHRTRPAGENAWVMLKDRSGADPSEWPLDLRVQEMPR